MSDKFKEIFSGKQIIFCDIDKVNNPKADWHTINFSDARNTYLKSVLFYNSENDCVVFVMFNNPQELQDILGISIEDAEEIINLENEGDTIYLEGNKYMKLW